MPWAPILFVLISGFVIIGGFMALCAVAHRYIIGIWPWEAE